MNGLTSGVFRDPFDIGCKSLDVEVVAVEIGALFIAEIWSPDRTFLVVARSEYIKRTGTKQFFS